MKKSGKSYTFTEEELLAMMGSGNAEGVMAKVTGLTAKKLPRGKSDIDALVDEILGAIDHPTKKKVKKKKTRTPARTPSYGGCGIVSRGGCGS